MENRIRYVCFGHSTWRECVGIDLFFLQSLGGIDLKNFQVMDAADYTKRKHVFKLLSRAPQHQSTSTIGHTEILVQAETDCQMNEWRDLLQSVCDPNSLLKKVRRDLDGIKLQRRKGFRGFQE